MTPSNYCNKCGSAASETASFCARCGSPLAGDHTSLPAVLPGVADLGNLAPKVEKKWYERTWVLLLILIVFWPLGLYLVWSSSFLKLPAKLAISLVLAVAVSAGILGIIHSGRVAQTPAASSPSVSQNVPATATTAKASTTDGDETVGRAILAALFRPLGSPVDEDREESGAVMRRWLCPDAGLPDSARELWFGELEGAAEVEHLPAPLKSLCYINHSFIPMGGVGLIKAVSLEFYRSPSDADRGRRLKGEPGYSYMITLHPRGIQMYLVGPEKEAFYCLQNGSDGGIKSGHCDGNALHDDPNPNARGQADGPDTTWPSTPDATTVADVRPTEPDAVLTQPFGYLDEASMSSGSLYARGWAADAGSAPESGVVVVSIDGKEAGRTAPNDPRQDVAQLRGSQYLKSGWHITLDAANLPPGRHIVTATAVWTVNSQSATAKLEGEKAIVAGPAH